MMHWIRLGFFLLVIGVVGWMHLLQAPSKSNVSDVRAVWVTRFDYTCPSDVEQIVANLADRGFTDLFFQVRGNGTVYYPSKLEPWAYQLSGNRMAMLGTDPGWDPLQLAIDLAHQQGLRIHAYMNVMVGWSGFELPPLNARQLWTEHPDWFMVDGAGNQMQPSGNWYAFLNPVMPEVRAHLRGIMAELCAYEVDGVHLDYIRYPHNYLLGAKKRYPNASYVELKQMSSFSFDSLSLQLQRNRYGENPTPNEVGDFRRDSVTRVVRDFSLLTQAKRGESFLLSASVLGDPNEAMFNGYQDTRAWVRQGLLDWAVQMNYSTSRFDENLRAMKKTVGARAWEESLVVGLFCENSVEDLLQQIDLVERSGCRGYALFTYGLLFDKSHRITEKGRILLDRIHP